jgi:hypothetical protein
MVSIDTFRRLALGFPDTDEHPHFHRKAFRVNKKIFATLDEKDKTGMLVLSPADQSVYCEMDPVCFYPVPGTWGKNGCTFVNLNKLKTAIFKEVLTLAWQTRLQKNQARSKKKPS